MTTADNQPQEVNDILENIENISHNDDNLIENPLIEMIPSGKSAHFINMTPLEKALQEVPRNYFSHSENTTHGKLDSKTSQSLYLHPKHVLAAMLDGINASPQRRVLLVGTDIGYAAAILSHLFMEVFAVERDPEFLHKTQKKLLELGYHNVSLNLGQPFQGWLTHAPYHAIVILEPTPAVPHHLTEQLAEAGELVAFVEKDKETQILVRVTRINEHTYQEDILSSARQAKRLGDLLVEKGVVERSLVEEFAKHATSSGKRLGEVLIETGSVDLMEIYHSLAHQRGLLFATAEMLNPTLDVSLYRSISVSEIPTEHILPVSLNFGSLSIAIDDPNIEVIDFIHRYNPKDVLIYLVTPYDFERLLDRCKNPESQLKGAQSNDIRKILAGGGATSGNTFKNKLKKKHDGYGLETQIQHNAESLSLMEQLLEDAVNQRASDIHVERYDGWIRTRYRIDGDLLEQKQINLNSNKLSQIILLLKMKCNIDDYNLPMPQQGTFHWRYQQFSWSIKIITHPGLYGEHLTLRLIKEDSKPLSIKSLGFSDKMHRAYVNALNAPSGIIVLSGTMGSGKTTTLYAGLIALAQDTKRKIFTIEHGIEYPIRGIIQTQISENSTISAADSIRWGLEEDSDVFMIGDLRDKNTAHEMLNASQTGKLMLTSLHTTSPIEAIYRLLEFGISHSMLANELKCVFFQRLAKRICPHCKTETWPESEVLTTLFPAGIPANTSWYEGVGCDHCQQRGTYGRVAVLEYIPIEKTLREAISKKASPEELRFLIQENGIESMQVAGLELAAQGIIPLSEVLGLSSNF